ncbi:IscS subfamily cysteine desulfurase [Alteromonas sp. V450]|uniref:IscS subfamily cysteine desulfurase n=1 Tax=Alteromonas sp. V450 TaxID=1912139 RepID=UPI0008FF71B0|nr:IscS subfamily cysteine desulfurase [Alteromonas sp. V450]OJF68936.1 IscS subfamily cysteine desulfurase [Alteromonas sp. V450]
MKNINLPIYLDYSSTTPVDPRVAEKMQASLTKEGNFGNPASNSHVYGWRASEAVEYARSQVARLVNAAPDEIIFTSGATESNNLAIKGVALSNQSKGNHIITSRTEHKAVLDSVHALENLGFKITYLTPLENGLIDIEQLKSEIRNDTILVSIMHVNNEIGVIQDIEAIGHVCRDNNVLFHVDAAQSTGKVAIDLTQLPVDLMSFSAHKTYGPKGIGALYASRAAWHLITAQMHGGGHEQGLRSGTLPTHQIVGMGEAFRLAKKEMQFECKKIAQLRDTLYSGLMSIGGICLNGDEKQRVAHNINVRFEHIENEDLIAALHGLAVSSGSACNSSSSKPSYVLTSLGLTDKQARNSIRFSIGRFTTTNEIHEAVDIIKRAIFNLREKRCVRDTPRNATINSTTHLVNKQPVTLYSNSLL